MPITCLNLFESNGKLQCFSGSSDGVLALIDIATTPQLELNVKELLQSSTGICVFVVYPSLSEKHEFGSFSRPTG